LFWNRDADCCLIKIFIYIESIVSYVMEEKRSSLAIFYGVVLLVLAAVSLGVYLFNILSDGIVGLYVFEFLQFGRPNFTAGSPIIPIGIGIVGIFTLLASGINSNVKRWSYKTGVIPLVLFVLLWSFGLMSSTVPFPRPTEDSGLGLFLMGGVALLLGIIALIPLIISLFSIFKNKTYLFSFGAILLFAVILQIGLNFATLPYEDSSIVSEAANRKDVSICYNILEGPGRYNCFQQVALSTLKIEHCYLIPKEYTYIYFGQRDNYQQGQCIANTEEAMSNPAPGNPQKFISNHGFSLDFPSDWQDYRYTMNEEKVRPSDQYAQPEYPDGYDIIKYEFGISAEDNVFQITIYGADHWGSGIAVGPRTSANVLGQKGGFVYVAMEGAVSKDGILPYQTDDIDSIIDSFKLI
jgi:hypothetical protein